MIQNAVRGDTSATPLADSRRRDMSSAATRRRAPTPHTPPPARRAVLRRCRASIRGRSERRSCRTSRTRRGRRKRSSVGHTELRRERHGRHVLGAGQRRPRQQRPAVPAVVVARAVDHARLGGRKVRRHVGQHAGRGESLFERQRVGERLQRRSRLPRRQRPVDGAAMLGVEVVARILPTRATRRVSLSSTTTATLAAPCRSSAARWVRDDAVDVAPAAPRRASSRCARAAAGRRPPAPSRRSAAQGRAACARANASRSLRASSTLAAVSTPAAFIRPSTCALARRRRLPGCDRD